MSTFINLILTNTGIVALRPPFHVWLAGNWKDERKENSYLNILFFWQRNARSTHIIDDLISPLRRLLCLQGLQWRLQFRVPHPFKASGHWVLPKRCWFGLVTEPAKCFLHSIRQWLSILPFPILDGTDWTKAFQFLL